MAVLPDSRSPRSDAHVVREYLDRTARSPEFDSATQAEYAERIGAALRRKRARLVAHYYTAGVLQDLALATDGFVGDSLEMARFGARSDADILVVAGVRFMGESAKILSPDKKVLMPTLEATCSLDIACPADAFSAFCDTHDDRTVVVYANTSAAVKARADWVVTSSIAEDVIEHLAAQGEKILWAPDRHLGRYLRDRTGADMLLWDAACIVHEEFKARGLRDMRRLYPEAAVLAHPESPAAVLDQADVIGSTTAIIKAAATCPQEDIIVATDKGIFHRLRQVAPRKRFIIAPTAGADATCRSCASCPWMAMNTLPSLLGALEDEDSEIHVAPDVARRALVPLRRMLDFTARHQLRATGRA